MNRPAPFITEFEDALYWKYCREEQLRVQKCNICGKFWWPISPICPKCFSDSYEWTTVKGEGTISNYIVYHKVYYPEFRGKIPYRVAEIELPEGVRVVGNIEGISNTASRKEIIGKKVKLYFEDCGEGLKIPQWKMAGE